MSPILGACPSVDRRTFLRRSLVAGVAARIGAGALHARQAPAIVTPEHMRPGIPQGVAAGYAGGYRAIIWSRSDRAARMFVEYSTTDKFENVQRVAGPAALETSDYTARTVLERLPPGQRIFYRVLFQDLSDLRAWSAPATASFATAPRRPGLARDVTLAWSGDTVGQGWGINQEWGGLRLYETMRDAGPDLFVHCGDSIYADQPLQPEVTLDNGAIWRNLVTPAKSKVAETLDDFRGNYQYNLLDDHMRRFNAAVAQVVIWDDHEVRDNWYETRDLDRDDRYRVKSAALLAALARRAFFEYNPLPVQADDPERIYRTVPYGDALDVFALDMRSYRGPNSANRQPVLDDAAALLGTRQLEWLKTQLAASTATWKVVASDMPIGLIVRDPPASYEAVSNADDGPPLGRELEIADLLRFVRDRRIRNVVWITADVHYCAAYHYDPSRGRFTEFDPFWEFVAGPLHAGTFPPTDLDSTFGPEAKFTGTQQGMKGNRPPTEGLQFFGTLRINQRTRAMTVALHNLSGQTVYSVELAPRR
jgi:alkaline phosphatase D